MAFINCLLKSEGNLFFVVERTWWHYDLLYIVQQIKRIREEAFAGLWEVEAQILIHRYKV